MASPALPCSMSRRSAAIPTSAARSERRWDLLGHGMTNTRFHLRASRRRGTRPLPRHAGDGARLTGVEMAGMGGPGPAGRHGEHARPARRGRLPLLRRPVPRRPAVSDPRAPGPTDLDAVFGRVERRAGLSTAFEGDQFLTMIKRQFDRLYAEGAQSGRVMCLAVHPHVIGQPQRTGISIWRWAT